MANIREELFHLYKECFKDSDKYSEYFIARKYLGNNVATKRVDGQLTSMLFVLPNAINVGGKILQCPFIAGVGTKEEFRKKGFARKLIYDSFFKLKKNGATAVSLVPENEAFYSPMGFTTYAYTEKKSVTKPTEVEVELTQEDAEEMLEVYNKYTENFYVKTERTVEQMRQRIEEFWIEGKVVGYKNGGKLLAYAMYFSPNDVDEVAYVDPFYVDKLGISNYRVPSTVGKNEAMIRVLDIKKFLTDIAYIPEFTLDMKIKITDEVIEDNNCVIRLTIKEQKAEIEDLGNDFEEFDIDYTCADLVSTILRSGVNVSFERF